MIRPRPRPALAVLLLSLVLGACAGPQQVELEPAHEARLATAVKVALVDDETLDAAAIFVDTDGDLVQLSGFTDTAVQRQRAAAVAGRVPGVARVENRIKVR